MDLTSRLRSIVRPSSKPVRELTYEPDDGYGPAASLDIERAGAALGGVPLQTPFGNCLVIDRRYEGDRWHGSVRVEDCELTDGDGLALLDPALAEWVRLKPDATGDPGGVRLPPAREALRRTRRSPGEGGQADRDPGSVRLPPTREALRRTVFLDLETTGLSGGAGTVAFLVGCGWFDMGAFQVRQFLLTSHAAERALLAAVADFFADCDLIVTYNGKTFDVPVMETRWAFHRIPMPLGAISHFDMLHPARRLWRRRTSSTSPHPGASTFALRATADKPCRTPPSPLRGFGAAGLPHPDDGCRLTTLERRLLDFHRVGDVPGFEIPERYFRFLRTGDARPLESVLEHNRLDLMSLAAVTARAARMAQDGHESCRDEAEALALGRIYERAERFDRAEACYRRATTSADPEVQGDAWCRLAVRCRRERRFGEAAECWRAIVALTEPSSVRRRGSLAGLRQLAVEALAIHHEHRERDLASAREMALFALKEGDGRRAEGIRHRIARLERKLAGRAASQLFGS
jgi:uncharacterized protein